MIFLIPVKKSIDNQIIIEKINRIPIQRKGYIVVRYKNKYHRLSGGIRTDFSVYLDKCFEYGKA